MASGAVAVGTEQVDGAQPAKKSKLKLIIIAAAAALVVAGGGGAALMMMSGGKAAQAEDHGAAAGEGAHGEAAEAHTFVFNLPPMTVNLNSEGETQSFLKLSIAMEVADEETMTLIQPRMARVIDAFQVYLRELRKSDLEGSAGIYRLKEELLRRINVAVAPSHVNSILFKEILVQ